MNDSRYPYTYACDYIRGFGGIDENGVRLSRSDASKIRQAIAKAIGMDDAVLAEKLADYYKASEEELNKTQVEELIRNFINR